MYEWKRESTNGVFTRMYAYDVLVPLVRYVAYRYLLSLRYLRGESFSGVGYIIYSYRFDPAGRKPIAKTKIAFVFPDSRRSLSSSILLVKPNNKICQNVKMPLMLIDMV